ncbi:MAG: protease SohB [Gammaproteobacteria bacterium]|nr:protease SohB [Gammaproteobacteria bacterium]
MMEILWDYLTFLLQTITVVIAIVVVIAVISSVAMRRTTDRTQVGHLTVRYLNDFYDAMRSTIEQASLSPGQVKKHRKAEQKEKKQKEKTEAKSSSEKSASATEQESSAKDEEDDTGENGKGDKEETEDSEEKQKSVYVLGFEGDLEASKVERLKHEISAVLTQATKNDEVVVKVESPGGVVHSYGYAASQLMRVRKAGVKLTVAVDEVAASGGYMIAVVADQILAAPFALVGSIGVAAEIPNVNRLLKKYDIDYEIITAGEFKRTLSVFGENTDAARKKFLEEIEDVHELFKEFVSNHRPDVDLSVVATGESWYGERALARNLIDDIMTSDEYIMNACDDSRVFELTWHPPKKQLSDILTQTATSMLSIARWLRRKLP